MAKSNEITTKFRLDISELKRNIQEAERQIRLANSEFKSATAGMDNWSKSSAGLTAKLTQLKSTLTSQKTILSNLKQQYAQVSEEQGENSKTAQELLIRIKNQEAAIGRTEKAMRTYEGELKDVQKAEELAAKNGKSVEENLKDIKDAANDAGEAAEKSSDGFTVMKGALANLAAQGIQMAISGLKELASSVIETGMQFESSMSQVQAVSGASTKEMELLNEKAKEMGATTKFTAAETADAFNYMAMAGWKTEDMLEGIDGILSLAAASGSDLATTSDIVTDALTAMGYSAGDAGKLADVMAAASSNANTNVELMGQTFQYAAPVIGAMGYSMEDAAVAIGLMANSGIKGEKAGTALRSILSRMAAPTKEVQNAMDKLGISITNADGTMKPMNEVITDLRGAFDGLSESEQAAMAKHIAGTEAMSGLLSIVNAAPEDFEKLTEAVDGSSGAAKEMADTMLDNLGGDITLMQSAFDGLKLSIYEGANEPLRNLVQSVTDNVIPAFSDLVGGVDGAGEKVGKAVGDLLSQAIKEVVKFGPTFIEIGTSLLTNLTLGIIENVPLLIQSAGEMIQALMNGIGEGIPQIIAQIPSLITGIIAAISVQLPQIIQAGIKMILSLLKGIMDTMPILIEQFPQAISTILTTIVEALPQLLQGGVKILQTIIAGLVETLPQLVDSLPLVIDTIIGVLEENLPLILEAAITLFHAIIDALPVIVDLLIKTLPTLITTSTNILVKSLPLILDAAITLFKGIIQALPTIIRLLIVEVPKLVTTITATLIAQLPLLLSTAIELFMAIVMAIPEMLPDLAKAVPQIIKEIVKGLVEGIPQMLEVGKDLVAGIWDGISSSFDWIKEKITGWVGNVTDFMMKLFGIHSPSTVMRDLIGKNIAYGVAEGITENKDAVEKAMQKLSADATTSFDLDVAKAKGKALAGSTTNGTNTGAASNSKIVNNTFNQYNTSPKALSRLDIYRQTKNQLAFAGGV